MRYYNRFRQFGGFRLLKDYKRLGLLSLFLKEIIRGKSFRDIYSNVQKQIEPYLIEKYYPLLLERKAYYNSLELEHKRSKYVWFCWLQGLEQAPPIVKACYTSLRQHLKEREIVVITENNWREYVDFPEHIISRWKSNQIPPAHFSDLLRLQLLIKYGGTWIDATVLCTGTEHSKAYLDSDFFLFQYREPSTSSVSFEGISNWYITSCTNNEILYVLRDMLCAYWKDYDCTLYYFLFHLFFSMVAKEYPDSIANMPYGYSVWSHTLQRHWNESFSQKKWDKLTSIVDFHKLTYRVDEKIKEDKNNYYNWILRTIYKWSREYLEVG